ncbi:unnamed protein product [Parnassius apollo]|uniref:(apollo) hypothetical protein n=1 Tax=Parnassius apollo TaxID=110799 RepID=A0A8S3VZP4_PARAO|nr:unnamed protein product [Parnassius apollo]
MEQYRKSLELNGLRISRTKTECMVCNFNPDETVPSVAEVKLDGIALPRVNKFKYLGSIITEDGSITADITYRKMSGWHKYINRSPLQSKNADKNQSQGL